MLALELGVIFVLVLCNAVFAGAEIAIVSSRQIRFQQLAAEGNRAARAVLEVRKNPERFFATVQVGISIIGASAGAFGGATFAEDLEPILAAWGMTADHAETASVVIVVAIVSYMSIVIGELVPKSLALKYSETYALWIARPLLMLSFIARPLIWLLTTSSNVVLKPFGDRTTFSEGKLSAEELQDLVSEASKSGAVAVQVGEIASRAFELEELTAKDVMIPREKIDAVPIDATIEQLQEILLEHGHERMPVYRQTLDDIAGYMIAKDVLALAWERELIIIPDLVRPAFFVKETMLARRVLREFQKRRLQLAIVVNEHNEVRGLITVEDILEELVGDLFDENDSEDGVTAR